MLLREKSCGLGRGSITKLLMLGLQSSFSQNIKVNFLRKYKKVFKLLDKIFNFLKHDKISF